MSMISYCKECGEEAAHPWIDLCDKHGRPQNEEKNQCDGCQAGEPIKDGLHVYTHKSGAESYMSCTKDRYVPQEEEKKCCQKCYIACEGNPRLSLCEKECSCHSPQSKERGLNKFIEQCIEIRGNKGYDGSYAAPREAFSKVLSLAIAEAKREERELIRKEVEGIVTEQKEPIKGKSGRNWQKIRAHWRGYQIALQTVLSKLTNTEG